MPGHGRQRQRATQGSMTMLVIQDKFAVDETIGIISPITRTYAARSMQRYGVRTSVCPSINRCSSVPQYVGPTGRRYRLISAAGNGAQQHSGQPHIRAVSRCQLT